MYKSSETFSKTWKSNDQSYFENEFIKLITTRYKTEIDTLKSYINVLNHEIRKKLNIEIPILSEEVLKKTETNDLIVLFNQSISKLQNFEYINPLFSLYEENINALNNELKNLKTLTNKYEKQISDLTRENNSLRENLFLKETELKEKFSLKLSNNENLVFDEDYIKQLDERNNILSRENEILLSNYQTINHELNDFQMTFNEKYRESLEKISLFDRIDEENKKMALALDTGMLQSQINEDKIIELTEKNSKLEIERNNNETQIEGLRNEIKDLNDALQFYKNYIYNINN
jgi:chromosome segregation ATPase